MEMLRRHMWVIDPAGIALGAVVSGQAAASLMVSVLPRPLAAHAAPAPSRPTPAVDGTPIDTRDAALAAYAKLRTTTRVWLTIERNGQRTGWTTTFADSARRRRPDVAAPVAV